MRKINTKDMTELNWSSPKGKFGGAEFYHVISGKGIVRHKDGTTAIEPGDAFIFEPDQPHQLTNDSLQDLVLYVVADNPIGESCYYPDSKKWSVRSPERRVMRSEPLDYYDGEE